MHLIQNQQKRGAGLEYLSNLFFSTLFLFSNPLHRVASYQPEIYLYLRWTPKPRGAIDEPKERQKKIRSAHQRKIDQTTDQSVPFSRLVTATKFARAVRHHVLPLHGGCDFSRVLERFVIPAMCVVWCSKRSAGVLIGNCQLNCTWRGVPPQGWCFCCSQVWF